MSKKLLIVLVSGLSAVVALFVAMSLMMGLPPPTLLHLLSEPEEPAFRFEAYCSVPNPDPDSWCGTGYGPRSVIWWGGPSDGLTTRTSEELAEASLDWFEDSLWADLWLGNDDPRLDLIYVSGDLDVIVRHARDSTHSWARQLEAWLEHFPPTETGGRPGWYAGRHTWDLGFGEAGEVRGIGPTAEEAVEKMRELAAACDSAALSGEPSFELNLMVPESAYMMNSYRVETSDLRELDALPRMLLEKRAASRPHVSFSR